MSSSVPARSDSLGATAREAVIDLDAIAANTAHGVESAAIAGIGQVLADVRLDAYGHGLVPVAHTVLASGATGLLVSAIDEGARLRKAGIAAQIHVVRPVIANLDEFVQHSLIPTVATAAELAAVVEAGSTLVDLDLTDPPGGLLAASEVGRLSAAIVARVRAGDVVVSAVFVEDSLLGVEPGGGTVVSSWEGAREAVQRLLDALAELDSFPLVVVNGPIDRLLTGATSPGTAVELGASLYGLVPHSDSTAAELGLTVAMTLATRVAVVKSVAAGEGVSYGYAYRTTKDTTVALCSFGYADGIHRSAGSAGVVWCNGRKHPLAGRVAMDVFMMDAEGHNVAVGDRVVLFGDPELGYPSPDDWAAAVSAYSPAVISSLGPRVVRRYIGGASGVSDWLNNPLNSDRPRGDLLTPDRSHQGAPDHNRLSRGPLESPETLTDSPVPDVEVTVDLAALKSNLGSLAQRVAPAAVMLIVKDDAYCHGATEVVRAAMTVGINRVGTFDVATAVGLRNAGVDDSVRLFAWMVEDPADYGVARARGIEVGISQVSALHEIAELPAGEPVPVHLKIDTGLHRNGANPEDWPALVDAAREYQLAGIISVESVWTHIAEASDDEDSRSIGRFEHAVEVARQRGLSVPLQHLAASAAGFERPDARFDLVRFGAFSYGIPPTHSASAAELGLTPIMTASARVLRIVESASGRRLGLIGFGSGKGLLSWHAVDAGLSTPADATAGPVAGWLGQSLPIIADLGLDRCWVDCSRSEVAVGDWVRLWGDGTAGESTLQEWGEACDTMGEEIVLRLPANVRKHYLRA